MSKATTELTRRGGTVDLTESERHSLLSAERRRIALEVLAERAGPIELESLAEAVAAREGGFDERDGDAAERVAIALHHAHLPKMADVGVVDYDPASRHVELNI